MQSWFYYLPSPYLNNRTTMSLQPRFPPSRRPWVMKEYIRQVFLSAYVPGPDSYLKIGLDLPHAEHEELLHRLELGCKLYSHQVDGRKVEDLVLSNEDAKLFAHILHYPRNADGSMAEETPAPHYGPPMPPFYRMDDYIQVEFFRVYQSGNFPDMTVARSQEDHEECLDALEEGCEMYRKQIEAMAIPANPIDQLLNSSKHLPGPAGHSMREHPHCSWCDPETTDCTITAPNKTVETPAVPQRSQSPAILPLSTPSSTSSTSMASVAQCCAQPDINSSIPTIPADSKKLTASTALPPIGNFSAPRASTVSPPKTTPSVSTAHRSPQTPKAEVSFALSALAIGIPRSALNHAARPASTLAANTQDLPASPGPSTAQSSPALPSPPSEPEETSTQATVSAPVSPSLAPYTSATPVPSIAPELPAPTPLPPSSAASPFVPIAPAPAQPTPASSTSAAQTGPASKVQRHAIAFAVDGKYECPYEGCERLFVTKGRLKNHVKDSHTSK